MQGLQKKLFSKNFAAINCYQILCSFKFIDLQSREGLQPVLYWEGGGEKFSYFLKLCYKIIPFDIFHSPPQLILKEICFLNYGRQLHLESIADTHNTCLSQHTKSL